MQRRLWWFYEASICDIRSGSQLPVWPRYVTYLDPPGKVGRRCLSVNSFSSTSRPSSSKKAATTPCLLITFVNSILLAIRGGFFYVNKNIFSTNQWPSERWHHCGNILSQFWTVCRICLVSKRRHLLVPHDIKSSKSTLKCVAESLVTEKCIGCGSYGQYFDLTICDIPSIDRAWPVKGVLATFPVMRLIAPIWPTKGATTQCFLIKFKNSVLLAITWWLLIMFENII